METLIPLSGCGAIRVRAVRLMATLAATVVLAVTSMLSTSAAARADDGSCPDVEVIFARGTNEPPGVGATGQAFTDALTTRLPGTSVDVYPVDYPASLDFQRASDGIVDAANKVEDVASTCPNTGIVLGGYSQGAAVVSYITADSIPDGYPLPPGIDGPLPPSTANHVATVALFGKPSNGFLNLVDRSAPPITIGHLYTNKTIDLCAPEDPVCASSGFSRAAHSAYRFNGMTDEAADFAASSVRGSR